MELGKYQHYKGGIVEAIAIAHHSESLEEMVVYRALYECKDFGLGSIWVRPKQMFCEDVVIDGKKMPRFKLMNK